MVFSAEVVVVERDRQIELNSSPAGGGAFRSSCALQIYLVCIHTYTEPPFPQGGGGWKEKHVAPVWHEIRQFLNKYVSCNLSWLLLWPYLMYPENNKTFF